jgi:hypothetical protein
MRSSGAGSHIADQPRSAGYAIGRFLGTQLSSGLLRDGLGNATLVIAPCNSGGAIARTGLRKLCQRHG